LTRENKGNGTWTTYGYDTAGQVIHLINYGVDATIISQFDYTYDANGNRTSMTTLEGKTSYLYEPIGQLTGVSYPDGHDVTYTYDAAGNRTVVNDNGTNTNYIANNLNQYTHAGDATNSYDADGNLISKTDSTGTTTYEFDSENRLVRIVSPTEGTLEYTYDGFGNRVFVSDNGQTMSYFHDPIGLVDVVAEYDGTGALVVRYDHGLGLADRVSSSGIAAYYNYDALGNTRELTSATGDVANKYDYKPFGDFLNKQETILNPFTYVGRHGVRTEGAGLLLMRERWYSTDLGSFKSVDPILLADSLGNNYRYAEGNPLLLADPNGTFFLFAPVLWAAGSNLVRHVSIRVLAGLVARPAIQQGLAGLATGALELIPGVALNLPGGLGAFGTGLVATETLIILYNLFTSVAERLKEPDPILDSILSAIAAAIDPNELIGPAGWGDANYRVATTPLPTG
jgi:RHS repeat-associated protein